MAPVWRRVQWLALAGLLLAAGACEEAQRDEEGRVRTAGELSVYELRTGDCFDGGERVAEAIGGERTVREVTAVPCEDPHDNEVFAVFSHPAGEEAAFPGEEEINDFAQDGCLERFPDYVGEPYEESPLELALIAPGAESWEEEDDRAIVCILYGDGPLEGSQRSSA